MPTDTETPQRETVPYYQRIWFVFLAALLSTTGTVLIVANWLAA